MKKSQEQFLEEAINIHNDKYGYEESKYINNSTKVKIFCKKCKDWFYQTPYSHIVSKAGCSCCAGNAKLTTEIFIEKVKLIHGESSFDYRTAFYQSFYKKVLIGCNKCNYLFEITPSNHLAGNGCIRCANRIKYNTVSFINKSLEIHKEKYGYDEVIFIDIKTKIKVFCFNCNIYFLIRPDCHLDGQGCHKCSVLRNSLSQEEFLKRAKLIHNDKFNYEHSIFNGTHKKIKIKCNTCNAIFEQRANHHLEGQGCPKCIILLNEKTVLIFLEKIFTDLIYQYKIYTDDGKKIYKIDFFIPSINLAIEYNGAQHYEPVCFGGISLSKAIENLEKQKSRDDNIKNILTEKKINLLEIDGRIYTKNKLQKFLFYYFKDFIK